MEYGLVIVDEDKRIIRFLEKPNWGEVFSDTINTGIYILEPEVFQYYRKGENFDFSKDLFPRLLKDGVPMYGYVAKEYWCDIGDLGTYINTHKDILDGKDRLSILGESHEDGIWIGRGSIIEKGAKLFPPIYIGRNTTIKTNARLEPYTVIGNNCLIGEGSSVKRGIIWDNGSVSKNCEIRKAVLCNNVRINKRARIFEDAVIGAYSNILDNSTIKPGVKVWPYKTIDEDSIINENMIWEERASKSYLEREIFREYIIPPSRRKLLLD